MLTLAGRQQFRLCVLLSCYAGEVLILLLLRVVLPPGVYSALNTVVCLVPGSLLDWSDQHKSLTCEAACRQLGCALAPHLCIPPPIPILSVPRPRVGKARLWRRAETASGASPACSPALSAAEVQRLDVCRPWWTVPT